jgi:hypothetical protein
MDIHQIANEVIVVYESHELQAAQQRAEICGCQTCQANLRLWQIWVAGEPEPADPAASTQRPGARNYPDPS